MPFESFETDEVLAKKPKRGRDLDTVMLFGCSGFVLVALVSWGFVVWPYFLFTDSHELRSLELCMALGMIPALAFGALVTRLFGLPAAAGFFGGAICASTFLFLRLQQVMAFRGVPEVPQPEYPPIWEWLLPLGWSVAALIVVLVFLRPSEYALDRPSKPKEPPEH